MKRAAHTRAPPTAHRASIAVRRRTIAALRDGRSRAFDRPRARRVPNSPPQRAIARATWAPPPSPRWRTASNRWAVSAPSATFSSLKAQKTAACTAMRVCAQNVARRAQSAATLCVASAATCNAFCLAAIVATTCVQSASAQSAICATSTRAKPARSRAGRAPRTCASRARNRGAVTASYATR
jgi:hypothetical protein